MQKYRSFDVATESVKGHGVTDERWVRSGTEAAPLVAIHTWRSEAEKYARLSDAMGGRTIYSSLPPDPARTAMPRRVDDWVDHHEAVLCSLDLTAPYRLVGWSFGGVLAVELARRLRGRGVEVAFVGLVDSIRPRLLPLSTREYVWYHLGAAAVMPDTERLPYLRQKARFLAVRKFPHAAAAARRLLVASGYRRAHTEKRSVKPKDPLKVSVHISYLNYRGDPVPFPVHVFATNASMQKAKEPVLRWLPWLQGGYELTMIEGGHFTIFETPHVTGLATALSQALHR
jgi:thioesterase domain-containing protein